MVSSQAVRGGLSLSKGCAVSRRTPYALWRAQSLITRRHLEYSLTLQALCVNAALHVVINRFQCIRMLLAPLVSLKAPYMFSITVNHPQFGCRSSYRTSTHQTLLHHTKVYPLYTWRGGARRIKRPCSAVQIHISHHINSRLIQKG